MPVHAASLADLADLVPLFSAYLDFYEVPAPEEQVRAFLAERLRGQGVQVDYLPLYRRRAPDYPAGELLARVRAERLNGLVVSSGQGLQNLYQLAAADWPEIGRLPLFVPSPRVAEMARELGAQRVIDCRGASAPALLAALTSAA